MDENIESALEAECPCGRLHTADISVMIRPEFQYEAVRATFHLRKEIATIRCEICPGPVGLEKRTVLVVTEIRRAKKERAVILIGQSLVAKRCDSPVRESLFHHVFPLGKKGIVRDMHLRFERLSDMFRKDIVRGRRPNLADAGFVGRRLIADMKLLPDFADILALIHRLFIAQDAVTELHHLPPGIVHVELARHRISHLAQDVRKRITEESSPAVPEMHRSRRIRRHELVVHACPFADPAVAVMTALPQDIRDNRCQSLVSKRDIDISRSSDHDTRTVDKLRDDQIGKIHRGFLGKLGNRECHIGRIFPVPLVAGPFDMDFRHTKRRKDSFLLQ